MPTLPRDAQVALGISPPPPGEEERDSKPKTKRLKTISNGIFRRKLELSDDKKKMVKDVLRGVWTEWEQNTSLLMSRLQRANDIMEGIKEPKTFPWVNSSNLHIPLIEIHITILHSIASSTMLENDPIWYVRTILDGSGESTDADIEKFLHWTCKIKLRIDNQLSDIYWNTYRDGTGIGDLDWVEEYETRYEIKSFKSMEDFELAYPTPDDLGMTQTQYDKISLDIIQKGEVQLKVEETMLKYRGPRLRVVELKDYVMVPVTAPSTEYAMFVGDVFVQRSDYFKRMVAAEWYDKSEVQLLLDSTGLSEAPDKGAQSQDRIEGLGRSRMSKPDEYRCLQGILKINLADDPLSPERMYLITYNKDTNALLRIEDYPYFHGRIKYIPWRFKKRPGRFLGQSIYDQLIDVNEEIDTQHNQRVDSRTITTVPSFIKTEFAQFDNTRSDQKFYPGVSFTVKSNKDLQQLVIQQTDMGQSLQEEQNLMQLADMRTGASQLRSGQSSQRDPRASGKKIQTQLQQSQIRVDDHMRELKIGTNELGSQILELYYQFSPETVTFFVKDPQTLQFIQKEILRSKLRSQNMFLDVARTSILDNPQALLQKYLTMYEIFSKEPLIATNIFRRRELVHRVLNAWREKDVDKLVPPIDELLKELQAQAGMQSPVASQPVQQLAQNMNNQGQGNRPSHEKRNGAVPPRSAQPGTNQQVGGE